MYFCMEFSACERLILLEANPEELRDYAALLYHCSYYEEALHYLKLYNDVKVTSCSILDRHSHSALFLTKKWALPLSFNLTHTFQLF